MVCCLVACVLNFWALRGYFERLQLVRWAAVAQAAVFIPVLWWLAIDLSPWGIGVLTLQVVLLLLPTSWRWFRMQETRA